jgi:hypothetical protein
MILFNNFSKNVNIKERLYLIIVFSIVAFQSIQFVFIFKKILKIENCLTGIN